MGDARPEDFDYDLPPDRIAQEPAPERGGSRLLVLDSSRDELVHAAFADLARWLREGDLLVRNDARVIPARLRGRRESGGQVEVLLLRRDEARGPGEVWSCLVRPARRIRANERIHLPGDLAGVWVPGRADDPRWRLRLAPPEGVLRYLERHGEMPLPPYIRRRAEGRDRERYQTVYARRPGAVAAPTAGLHFTAAAFGELTRRGVEIASVTLDVGPPTFLPLRGDRPGEHRPGAESVEIPEATSEAIARARRDGRRVVAVGTTTVRALEGSFDGRDVRPGRREVDLFIVPGFRFRTIDAMITNFHLPRSTLLMLVAAFAGRERILAAYREAIRKGYRFYSYGDAMLIL